MSQIKKATKNKKVAVVLFNLGGPDSLEAIRPFLMNFFMDKNIIRLPLPFRYMLSQLISRRRSKREAGQSYGELKNKSPLLENSEAQAVALANALNTDTAHDYKTFVCMRYWHPMSDQVARDVRDWGADEIMILPLYPQFSTTTTRSSLQVWHQAMRRLGMNAPISTICCYPWQDGFITAGAANIQAKIDQAIQDGHRNIRVLLSAHGLPESVIKKGDPYQWQCEQTAEGINALLSPLPQSLSLKGEGGVSYMSKTNLETAGEGDNVKIDSMICYQSKVGLQKWIGPSLDEALETAAADKKCVIIYPHAFTQEHVETLVELDIEYHEMADKLGIKGYYRADTVGTHTGFINGLKEMVLNHTGSETIQSDQKKRLCPKEFSECCMRG